MKLKMLMTCIFGFIENNSSGIKRTPFHEKDRSLKHENQKKKNRILACLNPKCSKTAKFLAAHDQQISEHDFD